jgi:hypothetical protein
MTTFWRTFHHDGKIKSAEPGEGGAVLPLSLYLPSRAKLLRTVYTPAERADTLPLFLLYPYMYSVGRTQPNQKLPLWLGGDGVKTTENKIH